MLICSSLMSHPEWQGLDTLHIISGLSSTQTLLEASSVNQVATNSASGRQARRHHKFEADGTNVAEANLPGKDGLQALVDEARRLADVNMVGVAVSVAAFVRRSALLVQPNAQLRTIAPSSLFHIQISAHPPSFFRRWAGPRPDASTLRRYQSRWFGMFQKCGGREWRRAERREVPR